MGTNTDKYYISIQLDVRDQGKVKELVKELERVGGTIPKTERPLKQMNKNLKQTQIQMRSTGRGMQNFSYQLQDVIVQVSGGVDPLRSLSQQLPQMLIGFGALGAVIGVVAAGLPVLIQQFTETRSSATLLTEAIDELDDAVDGMDRAVTNFKKSGTELNKLLLDINKNVVKRELVDFIEQFNESLNPSKIQAFIQELKILKGEIEAVYEEGQELADNNPFIRFATDVLTKVFPSLNLWGAAYDAVIAAGNELEEGAGAQAAALNLLSEAYNLSVEDAEKAQAVMKRLGDQASVTSSDIEELAAILREGVSSGEFSGKGLANLIERLREGAKIRAAEKGELEEISVLTTKISADMDAIYEKGRARQEERDAFVRQLVETKEILADATNNTIKEDVSLTTESLEIFLNTFDSVADGVARGTQSMSEAFESMTKSILLQIGKLLAIQGIGSALSGQGGFLGQVGAALLAEKGAVVSGGSHLTAYAKGGVVSGPTVFPMKNGAGLMGEAGAEAVMPLTRMSNGNLGVESSGMNVVINNNAPGVDVRPRQTDQGLTIDVVMSAVAQAVTRGGNEVAESIENSYALNRGRAVYGN